jgi:hypothetical protein
MPKFRFGLNQNRNHIETETKNWNYNIKPYFITVTKNLKIPYHSCPIEKTFIVMRIWDQINDLLLLFIIIITVYTRVLVDPRISRNAN